MKRTVAALAFLLAAIPLLSPTPLAAAQPSSHGEKPIRKAPAARPETFKSAPKPSGARYAGEPISLDLKDADLKDVLRTFAELTKLNIAIDPEVKGSVTVRLQDVSWDQALDLILEINGLVYVLEGNVVRVGEPRKLFARD